MTSEELMTKYAVQLARASVTEPPLPPVPDPYAGFPVAWHCWRATYIAAELNTPLEVEAYRAGLETKH